MNIEEYREYCLTKPQTSEGLPFDDNVLVFKVAGKMFALTDLQLFESINLKCDPDRALELRAEHPGIIGGYHMNKKHWNTVSTDGSVSDKLIFELIDHSYHLVCSSFSKKKQQELGLKTNSTQN
jgi:predicted DNA-binding protein (MmcQ/YjbR family)